tara:strand:- start:1252 stop:1992 length:741 start_codon:yes stop_codon:yes gene_type:complete
MLRDLFCVANFKMNKNRYETISYLKKLSILNKIKSKTNLIVCPPYTSLTESIKNISLGVQNINSNTNGAYTGEISAEMVCDFDVQYVILGHSERREFFNENDNEINKKIKIALKYNLKPILCVGENLNQRKNNQVLKILEQQLSISLDNIDIKSNIVIAYEPVWAIGTGETASTDLITETHNMIRKILNDIGFDGEKISILYGGSVNRNNAKDLIALKDVDGFLIGGASLDVNHFYDIFKYIEESV